MDASREAFAALASPKWCFQAHMLPADTELTAYTGILDAKGSSYRVALASTEAEAAPPLRAAGAGVWCSPPLHEVLLPQQQLLAARLSQSPSVSALLQELHVAASSAVDTPESASAALQTAYFSALVRGCDAIGWACVRSYAHDSRLLEVVVDVEGVPHSLALCLPPEFPAAPPDCRVDVPQPFALRWGDGCGLHTVVAQFTAFAGRFSDFWKAMLDFDENSWVLDPAPGPHRLGSTFRRIAVGKYSWLHVDVSVTEPMAQCECRFVGSTAVVAPLQQAFNARLKLWDRDLLPRQNLEAILQVTFPKPASNAGASLEDLALECGICYCFKLPVGDGVEVTPEYRCETPTCGRPYHKACVVEWLASLPTTRRSFGVLFGTCPYCQQTMSVSGDGGDAK